jgi:dTDP-4-amino-4,6-dideoxyglucose formyltransferase
MLFYKRVLVISDNSALVQEFDKLIRKKDLFEKIFISYKHSPTSNIGLLQLITKSTKLDADIINLKDEAVVKQIIKDYDLVFSLHCKQLFPKSLFQYVKCLNIHPGFNPLNRGWFPQVFAIIHNLKLGATIHEINEDLDNGPIIVREHVPLYEWDTSLSAYNRVLIKEIELLDKHLISILANRYSILKAEDIADEEHHLYTKKDYNKLLQINLEEKGKFRDFLNHLRALSHGEYKNAYFISSEGKKVFLNISLEVID